jgi:hypothetical protein
MASCTLSALPIISNPTNSSSPTLPWRLNPHNLATSLFGRKLSIRPSSSRRFVSKHRPAIATVLSSLPTLYVQWFQCVCYVCMRGICSFLALVEMIYLLLFPGNQRGLLLRKPQCEWISILYVLPCVYVVKFMRCEWVLVLGVFYEWLFGLRVMWSDGRRGQ